MLKGCLPWTNLDGVDNTSTKYDQISRVYEAKKSFSFQEKTPGDVPQEFFNFVQMSRALKFDELPPYLKMRRMFKELFVRSYYEFDYVYDWFLVPMRKV